jgi:uncharacterized protein (DUF1778 family)
MPDNDQTRLKLIASLEAKTTISPADPDNPSLLLSHQAFEAFAKHIETPPQPTEALRQIMARRPPGKD